MARPSTISAEPATTTQPVAAPGPVNANALDDARTGDAAAEGDAVPAGSLFDEAALVAAGCVVGVERAGSEEFVEFELGVVVAPESPDGTLEAVTGATGCVVVDGAAGSGVVVAGTVVGVTPSLVNRIGAVALSPAASPKVRVHVVPAACCAGVGGQG